MGRRRFVRRIGHLAGARGFHFLEHAAEQVGVALGFDAGAASASLISAIVPSRKAMRVSSSTTRDSSASPPSSHQACFSVRSERPRPMP
jgi:hypothetical protein